MQSAMNATCDKAAITGAEPPMASLAPVERIATGGELTSIAHGLALIGEEDDPTRWAA